MNILANQITDLDGVPRLIQRDGAAPVHVELPEQPVAVVLRPEESTVGLSNSAP
jgi:hypothetical protein